MEENGYRFGVGVLVLSSILIGILLVVFFGAMPRLWNTRYTVTINFKKAPGIGVDTPVSKNGVTIGRVSSVKLLPGNKGVNVSLELDESVEILNRDQCRIGTGSLITGDGKVEFVSFDDTNHPSVIERFDGIGGAPKNGSLDPQEVEIASMPVKNGDYLQGGVVAGDPMNVIVDMQKTAEETMSAIALAARRIDSLGESFQGVIGGNEGNVQSVVNKTKEALDNFNRTAESIRNVIQQVENSRVPEAFADVLENLPAILKEAETVVKQTKATLRSFELVGDNFQEVGKTATDTLTTFKEAGSTANSAIKNLEEVTEPLKGEGKRLVENVVQTLENLDGFVTDLRQISQQVQSGRGTVGRLLQDDQLYYRAVGTLENVEQLTRKLEPSLNDLRIFTDKVSRDPSSLIGIRGIVNGRPQGIGIK